MIFFYLSQKLTRHGGQLHCGPPERSKLGIRADSELVSLVLQLLGDFFLIGNLALQPGRWAYLA
jgi:hypothetical protein